MDPIQEKQEAGNAIMAVATGILGVVEQASRFASKLSEKLKEEALEGAVQLATFFGAAYGSSLGRICCKSLNIPVPERSFWHVLSYMVDNSQRAIAEKSYSEKERAIA